MMINLGPGANVINIYGRTFIAKEICIYINISVDLPVNHNIFLTRQLSPVNYGKKSVNDNIGPRSL
jgi:hypothetical protein